MAGNSFRLDFAIVHPLLFCCCIASCLLLFQIGSFCWIDSMKILSSLYTYLLSDISFIVPLLCIGKYFDALLVIHTFFRWFEIETFPFVPSCRFRQTLLKFYINDIVFLRILLNCLLILSLSLCPSFHQCIIGNDSWECLFGIPSI